MLFGTDVFLNVIDFWLQMHFHLDKPLFYFLTENIGLHYFFMFGKFDPAMESKDCAFYGCFHQIAREQILTLDKMHYLKNVLTHVCATYTV